MACNDPILAVSIMKNSEGKHVLKFLPSDQINVLEDKRLVYGSDEVFLLPCMKCKPCREAYARDWSVRCSLEAKMHSYNYFLTLTYDNQHIYHSSKADFTRFLKLLNYKLTGHRDRPKFFACQERGELTQRLHFHCILFLDKPLDLIKPVKIGDFYHFSCSLLENCWKNGFVDVAPFVSDCARYVAKYSTKQGNCFMSRNLAKSYYLKHRSDIIKDDFIVYGDFNGKDHVDIPKCFVKWFIEDHCSEIDGFKLSKSKLQRLLISQDIRNNRFTCEGAYLKNKIFVQLKHEKSMKGRSDL